MSDDGLSRPDVDEMEELAADALLAVFRFVSAVRRGFDERTGQAYRDDPVSFSVLLRPDGAHELSVGLLHAGELVTVASSSAAPASSGSGLH